MLPEFVLEDMNASLYEHYATFIKRLNQKIEEYNAASVIGPGLDEMYCCNLLQEINFIVGEGKRITMDNAHLPLLTYEFDKYEIDNQISDELEKFTKNRAFGYTANHLLTGKLTSHDGLFTPEEWNHLNSSPSWIFFTTLSEESQSVISELRKLNEEKKDLRTFDDQAFSQEDKKLSQDKFENYFYNLQSLKQKILYKLAFELDSKDIRNFRQLLARVNHEINFAQQNVPDLEERFHKVNDFIQSNLFKKITTLTTSDKDRLKENLKKMPLSSAAIEAEDKKSSEGAIDQNSQNFPVLEGYEITLVCRNNNVIYLITDHSEGEQFVLQIDEPSANQGLLNHLNTTLAAKYFAQEYYISPSSSPEAPYRLVITEYAKGGDLKHESGQREKKPDHEILAAAIHRMEQLTKVCETLSENNVVHIDIKLTNFLDDGNGNIIITDKKSFKPTENHQLIKSGLATTELYAPPEIEKSAVSAVLNADKFMSYQLGLALYEYLIPGFPLAEEFKGWVRAKLDNKSPLLDFKHKNFNSESGQQIKMLIKEMTSEDPAKRPSLEEVRKRLTTINNQLNEFIAAKQKDQIASSLQVEPYTPDNPQEDKTQTPPINPGEKEELDVAKEKEEGGEEEKHDEIESINKRRPDQ